MGVDFLFRLFFTEVPNRRWRWRFVQQRSYKRYVRSVVDPIFEIVVNPFQPFRNITVKLWQAMFFVL